MLLRDTDRPAEAEPLFRRALAIIEGSYGPDHPHVVAALYSLAMLLRDTDRPAEAEPLFRRALAIIEGSYGPDHPAVATVLNDLAGLLRDTDRLAEAEPLCRRALQILIRFRRRTGQEHPNGHLVRDGYRNLLQAGGKTSEEVERSVRELEESVGPEGC
jgi:tetratricopeptide (TPR) repeat protein